MTLDVRGSIKNTKLSSNKYVLFEELISNSIDSFLIRRHDDSSVNNMTISVEVNFQPADIFAVKEDMKIVCKDNGCGLGDEQLKSFLTKDTSYKDDLPIIGIGKCKGSGRIQFFHQFSALSIVSNYRVGLSVKKRDMIYREPQKQIDTDDFRINTGSEEDIGTKICLENFKDIARSRLASGEPLSSLYSASVLKKQMLVVFLQRLVSLDGRLGDFEIKFITDHWISGEQIETLKRSDLPKVTSEKTVLVEECDASTGMMLGTHQKFKLSHYHLDTNLFDLPRNAIAFCAKSSPVKDITSRYLRTRTEQNNPLDGFHHIILIESDYLDERVNEQRDDFDNIPDDFTARDLFLLNKISYENIYAAIDPIIDGMVVPAAWNKIKIIQEVAESFGISEAMLQDTSTRVVYGESARAVAERVLKKYQERVVDETAEIMSLKDEIIRTEPDTEDFRKKINELSWKYTSSLKNFDMANLSQLIVRRAAVVEILALACKKELSIQQAVDGRRKDERIIHSVFFPMRKDSTEFSDHDVWLLNEEYHYYDYIASDVPLSNITYEDGTKVFDSGIDDELKSIFLRRVHENERKRPDIAIFSKEGSAIIIEFKAPGISTDAHIGDLSEYAHLLAAKSGGRLKKFYGYLIGDSVDPLRLSGSWTPFPLGNGWFQSSPLIDPTTRGLLGETYFEILHYSDVIERARKRIAVYQEKLKLSLSGN
ncbi:hypothetical protein ACFZ8E_05015 [Methylobacterium sp. HMF5984]|uniref:hypothetical protein n=1 Tax=Methylobacterium sp. HMF5984 TaxID=3367370 RepID=UPI003852C37C